MAIATFTIAIDRPPRKDGTKEADFPRVTVFGRQAENCERYLAKGLLVGIEGHLQTGSYINKTGDKVYTTDVVADRVEFLEWANEKNNSEPNQNSPSNNQIENHQAQNFTNDQQKENYQMGFQPLGEEDIPF